MHARFVRRRVKKWRLQRACATHARSGLRAGDRIPNSRSGSRRARLHFLFDRSSGQWIIGNNVAESAARANVRATALYFHLQSVAASRRRFRRRVPQQVILALFACDLFQSGHQVVCVQDGEATGSSCQRVHHLLIGGCGRRKLRNNLPRLIVRSIAVRVARTASPPASRATARSASAASSPTLAASGSTPRAAASSASRAATCAASGTSTAAVSAACPATTGPAAVLWLGK